MCSFVEEVDASLQILLFIYLYIKRQMANIAAVVAATYLRINQTFQKSKSHSQWLCNFCHARFNLAMTVRLSYFII